MQSIGSLIIALVLALVGVCPLNIPEFTFNLGDTLILLGCLIFWSIVAKDK